MEITLNLDRGSFCVIGEHSFTFGEPGPKEISITTLSLEEKNQLLYNIKRGTLLSNDPEASQKLAEAGVGTPAYSTPQEIPIHTVLPPKDALLEDVKELKGILKGTVASVKKAALDLRPGRLRKLADLEREGKKRKSMITFLGQLIERHAQGVLESCGEDLEAQDTVKIKELSTQLTDIVESEEEAINFKIAEDEDGELYTIPANE